MKGKYKKKYGTGVQQIYNDTPDYSKIQNRRAERDALENTGLSVANEFGGQYKSLAQGGNLLGKTIEGNGNNKGKAIAGKAVSYGSTGAAVGMQVGGPIGGAIGGGVGLIGGGIIGAMNYDKDRQLKLQADKLAYKTNANKKFTEGSSTDAQSFLAKKGKYKVKARVIETEGREPIFSPKKADGSRDLLYYNPNDPTHKEGGVKMAVTKKGCGAKNMKYAKGVKSVGPPNKPTTQDSLDLYNFTKFQMAREKSSDFEPTNFKELLSTGQSVKLNEKGIKNRDVVTKAAKMILGRNTNLKVGLVDNPTPSNVEYDEKGSYDIYHPNIKPKGTWRGTALNNDYSNVYPKSLLNKKPVTPVTKERLPIQTTDKRKVQAYNDSLNLYNESTQKLNTQKFQEEQKVNEYNKTVKWYNTKNKGSVLHNEYIFKPNEVHSSYKKNGVAPIKFESYSGFTDPDFNNTNIAEGQPNIAIFKKPEQPYVLKKNDFKKPLSKPKDFATDVSKDKYLQQINKQKNKPISYQVNDLGEYHFEYKKPVDKPKPVTTKPLPPIVVTDPNDPRLKAYNDSLTVYKDNTWNYNEKGMDNLVPISKENKLIFTNKKGIAPILWQGKKGGAGHPVYKKPEQPYVYKKPVTKKADDYQTWRSKLPKNLQYEGDYDLRGFYKENPNFSAKEGEHMTDKFKKPNHPTFSNESKYYREGMKAGKWEGDKYIPIPAIEKMNGKTATLETSELPINTPKAINNPIKKGGKFAQYPTMKKQLRYKQSASRMVNAKPVTNIVNTFAKGTSKLKVADPPPSAVFDNTYLGDDGSFQLSPEDIKTPTNKLRRKTNNPEAQKSEASEVPTYYPSSLEWTKAVKRLDKNGNETNTSLMQDLNNPVHVMYHKNGKANFVYLRGEEDKQAAVNRALVETFGPSSAKQREAGTALFDEGTEKKIIEDYKKRNGYTEESFTYKKGVSKMKYKKGTKAVQYENTIPEGSSIVTSEGGMNKKALQAYQNKDWNTLDKIINSMPEDKSGKADKGKKILRSGTFKSRGFYKELPVLKGGSNYGREMSEADANNLYSLSDADLRKRSKATYDIESNRRKAVGMGLNKYTVPGYNDKKTGKPLVYNAGETSTQMLTNKTPSLVNSNVSALPKPNLQTVNTTPNPNTDPGKGKGFDASSIPSIAEITARQSILNKGVDPVQENYLKLGRYKYASQLPKNLQENMMATNTAKSTVKNVSAGNVGNYLSNVGNLTTSRLRANNDAVIADTLGRQEILNKNVDLGNTEVQTNLGLKNQYNEQKAQNLGAYNNQIIAQGTSIDSTLDSMQKENWAKKRDNQLMNNLKTRNYSWNKNTDTFDVHKKGVKKLKYKK